MRVGGPFELTGDELAAAVHGALEVEVDRDGVRPWRLPSTSLRYADPGLALMSEFTAGVHIRLVTAAQHLTIDAGIERPVPPGRRVPSAPATFVATAADEVIGRVDVVDTGLIHRASSDPIRQRTVPRVRVELPLTPGDAERSIDVWLPQDAAVALHAISADSPIRADSSTTGPRWIHYGSSISQGGSAESPLGTWPRQAADLLGLEGVNLGFGGNAMLDSCVARAIAGEPVDLITLEIGINIVGADSMRSRTLSSAVHGFLDIIRDGHPATPIVVITAIACPAVEDTPGPIRVGPDSRAVGTPREIREGDGTLTLAITRKIIAEAVGRRVEHDSAIFLYDGLSLLGRDESELLPDGLHPGRSGLELIATRFARAARDGDLGVAFPLTLVRSPDPTD